MKRQALSILHEDKASAQRFAEKASKVRAHAALERAQRELNERLQQAIATGPGDGSFTVAQLRATLEQVRAVLGPLTKSLGGTMIDLGKQAAAMSAKDALQYVQAAEDEYGLGRTLPLDTAVLVDVAVSGTHASMARRIASDPNHPGQPGVLARYGLATMSKFEEGLQQRIIQGKPWEAVKADLVSSSPFLQGQPAHWAERLLRTEAMYASNKGGFEAMKQVENVIGLMLKILVATFDDRTGADSYAVHGQIRRTAEAFESWFGPYQHPPNRPNDREVVVPHHMSWPLPAELKPRSDGEVASRWAQEGRKGSPPPRPLMSTVPVEDIGKVLPPPIPEEPPPPLALEPMPLAPPVEQVPAVSAPLPAPPVSYSFPSPMGVQGGPSIPLLEPSILIPPVEQAHAYQTELARAVAHITSPLVEIGKATRLGGGANVSKKLAWKNEQGKPVKGVWKPVEGEERGLRYNIKAGTYHKREAAAYALDAMMGGETVVPPTVSRTVKGQAGSLQEFKAGTTVAKTAIAEGVLPIDLDHPTVRRMQLLDYISGNTDRHNGNWMVGKNGEAVAIDNGLAFPAGPPERLLLPGSSSDPKKARLLEIDDAQKEMLAKLDPEAVGRMLFDHGLEPQAVETALTRLVALKTDPDFMSRKYAALKRNGLAYSETAAGVAEEWATVDYKNVIRPLAQMELFNLIDRITPP